MHVLNNMQREG